MIFPIGDQPNPKGTPWVNYLLIGANVGVFLLITLPKMWSYPDPGDPLVQAYLRELFARYPGEDPQALAALVLQKLSAYDIFLGRWGYRPAEPSLLALFTSMFLHGGFLHIIGNMVFLWIYGDNVEHRLGAAGYLCAYLVTGLMAAALYGLFVPASAGNVPMVGASGAISGVLGFYFIWFPRNKVRLLIFLFPIFVFTWLVSARLVLGFFILIENLLPFLLTPSGTGGVAYGAHIGGFLAGVIGAVLMNQWFAWRCRRQAAGCAPARLGADAAPSPEAVALAAREGQTLEAVQTYLSLLPSERPAVPTDLVADLADSLAGDGQPDAALALYRQAISDHPSGPGLDRIFLGIGLALLHGKGRPSAAYPYLLDVLDAEPRPEVERAAREALVDIERRQKWQVRERRGL